MKYGLAGVYAVFVLAAAVHFQNTELLWWWLLIVAMI